jgi:hypothetical protein
MSDVGNVKIARWRTPLRHTIIANPHKRWPRHRRQAKFPSFLPAFGVPQAVHQRRRKPPVGVKKQKDGKREQAGLGEAWKSFLLNTTLGTGHPVGQH